MALPPAASSAGAVGRAPASPAALRARVCVALGVVSALIAAAAALATLMAWALGHPASANLGLGPVASAPHAAVGLLLLAGSVILQRRPTEWRWVAAGRVLALLAAAGGAFFLAEVLSGASVYFIDSLFFPRMVAAAHYRMAGRPSALTSACFIVAGLALAFLDKPVWGRRWAAEVAALVIGTVAFEALASFVLGATPLYQSLTHPVPMAVNTAVALGAIAMGMLLIRPGRGLVGLATGEDIGGRVARALLPAAVLVPAVLGSLHIVGQLRGFFDTATGDALLLVANVVLFALAVAATAAVLKRLEARRVAVEIELRLSERQLRSQLAEIESIYANAPVGLCVLDPDLRFLRINARLAEINGLSPDAHLGRTVREIARHLPEQAESHMRMALQTGEPVLGVEVTGPTMGHPDVYGHRVESYLPIRGDDGAILGLNVVVEDVTEQKRALQRLYASEERNRQLVEQAAVGIVQCAPDGTLRAVNPGFCRIVGYEAEELVGRSVWEITHAADASGARVAEERIRRGETSGYSTERRFLRRDGEAVWCAVTASAVRDAQGGALFTVAIVQDITARRTAELERVALTGQLAVEREQLRTILELAPAGIAVLQGPDLRVRSANAALRRYCNGREILGRPLRDALPELTGTGLFEQMEHAFHTGNPYTGQEIPVRGLRVGTLTYWDVVFHPLRNPDGNVYGVLLHAVSVTDRVRARIGAEESSRAKSQFLAAMSHEFRTPLGAIVGYSDLLVSGMAGELSTRQRDHLRNIRASAWHLTGLVEQVLTFSRAEAGRLDVTPEWVDAAAIVREVAALLKPEADGKGLALETAIAADPLPLETDSGKLRQILLNLVGNAVKFTESGRVAIEAERLATELCVRVSDTGPGIEPADQEAVFELFVRPGASASAKPGAGLGLPVCRQLTRLLGGQLALESVPGRGSAFTLRLPLRAPESVRAG